MAQQEVHKTISLIDNEIRQKETGSPIELAGRLHMSVRMLYFYLDMMDCLGARIIFSKQLNSFVYQQGGFFKDGIRWIEYQRV
ncbi:hypothetical protein [Carboxylicivirga sp. M1479]|uniref:hypothetical protein n=1 Tax=Carboxylicivirga sp. M1479 TaxID=2594476 RepID=UPI0011779B00|nr:hypothetical protein [Carboxylicivirga sp. M1479]TRX65799.1 hypothetical protein FNN09_16995 [Carboxylicivirga sp. M1479]